jgi:hypothetical protein
MAKASHADRFIDDIPHIGPAYREGIAARVAGRPRHDRPSYLTHKEREAFNMGWDSCNDSIAKGFRPIPWNTNRA